jgi:hypothetical protein
MLVEQHSTTSGCEIQVSEFSSNQYSKRELKNLNLIYE